MDSNHFGSLVACAFQSWLGHFSVLEGADEGIGILFLIEVAESMVDTTMTSFVGADVQNKVFHGAVAFRHIPVLIQTMLFQLVLLNRATLDRQGQVYRRGLIITWESTYPNGDIRYLKLRVRPFW